MEQLKNSVDELYVALEQNTGGPNDYCHIMGKLERIKARLHVFAPPMQAAAVPPPGEVPLQLQQPPPPPGLVADMPPPANVPQHPAVPQAAPNLNQPSQELKNNWEPFDSRILVDGPPNYVLWLSNKVLNENNTVTDKLPIITPGIKNALKAGSPPYSFVNSTFWSSRSVPVSIVSNRLPVPKRTIAGMLYSETPATASGRYLLTLRVELDQLLELGDQPESSHAKHGRIE